MTAEQELAQDYILTTETSFYSEKANYEETDDFIIFNHEHLEPTLHIYSASGKLINSVNLPEDVIDMVR